MNQRESRNFNEMYKNTNQRRNYNNMSPHEKCSVWINHDNYAVAELV